MRRYLYNVQCGGHRNLLQTLSARSDQPQTLLYMHTTPALSVQIFYTAPIPLSIDLHSYLLHGNPVKGSNGLEKVKEKRKKLEWILMEM